AGVPGERRFVAAHEFDENQTHLSLSPHGFGVLGIRFKYCAAMSVLLLLLYLFDRHADDETFQNRLSFAARLCGEQFFNGIPITQQIQLNYSLLKQVCDRFPIEAKGIV
ncbi:MAG TPA: hypothetical protein VF478_02650, partial [Anaerolineae bacterium]